MPRPRFLKLPEDKRLRIIEAAGQEFGAHGFEGASLNRIIAAAGISKGAMYYYFDGKGDLFATVFRFAEEQLLDLRHFDLGQVDRDSFWPALERLTQVKQGFLEAHPWMMGMARAFYQMPREQWLEGEMGAYISELHTFLSAVLAKGVAVGAIRDDMPPDLMMALWMAVDETFDRWVLAQWETHGIPDGAWDAFFALGIDLMRRITQPGPQANPREREETP